MRDSTGSPLFSDFILDPSRSLVSRSLIEGNKDPEYEGGFWLRVRGVPQRSGRRQSRDERQLILKGSGAENT